MKKKKKKIVEIFPVFEYLLILPKNDFQTSSTINFHKNVHILEAWKPTEDMKFRLDFFFTCPSTYVLNLI